MITCSLLPGAQAQTIALGWDWVQPIGGGVGNQSTCYGVAADANGNSYIAGGFAGVGHFGTFTLTSALQTKQPYVAKLGPSGAYQWVATVTGYGRGEAQAIAVDAAGNTYVTGNFDGTITFGATTLTPMGSNDVFVAKLSPAGTWLWATAGGGYSLDVGRTIAVSPSGSVYVAGQIRDQATFGSTPALQATLGFADIFVAALDAATGTWQWSRCAVGDVNTTAANNYGWSLGLNAAGEVYLAGLYAGQATFGTTTLTMPGIANDIFVAKLTATGTWLWARRAGGNNSDNCQNLAVDAAGNVYITGGYSLQATFGSTVLTGSGKVFVAKLDTNGNWQWAYQSAGTGSINGRGLAFDRTRQQLYLAGNFTGTVVLGATSITSTSITSTGPYDHYVAALSDAGTWLWAQTARGTDRMITNALATDANSVVYTCGYVLGTAAFGTAALVHPNPPAEQPYVARLAAALPTATKRPLVKSAAAWPCPAAPSEAVHLRWETEQRPSLVIVRDVLGREVYRKALEMAATTEVVFSAPALAGWYQYQVFADGVPATSANFIVQP